MSCLSLGFMADQVYASGCTNFTTGIVSPIASITMCTGGATGNDSHNAFLAATGPTQQMEVSVCDDAPCYGGSPALAWNDGTCQGNIPLPTVTRYPDVALVESKNTNLGRTLWWAIVVYEDVSTGFCMCDMYYYTAPTCATATWTLYSTAILLDPGLNKAVFYKTIRIDADRDGNFVIIWDDNNNYPGILVTSGQNSVTAEPALSTKYRQLIANSGSIQYATPDVSTVGTTYYVYVDINANPNALYVGQCLFSDIWNGSLSSNVVPFQTFSTSGLYSNPRIACPPIGSTCATNSWTAVSEFIANGSANYDIIGYTSYCGTIFGMNIYTDGSLLCAGFPINGNANVLPAVGYDNINQDIMIGWDCGYSTYSGFTPTQSVVLECNYADGSLAGTNYELAATTNGADNARYLSISGRDYYYSSAAYMQYTYCNLNSPVMSYKDIKTATGHLRMGQTTGEKEDNFDIFPNPFTGEVSVNFASDFARIKVFDLTGYLLLNVYGKEEEINRSLNELTVTLPKGVYMLRLEINDGSDFENKKFVKM